MVFGNLAQDCPLNRIFYYNKEHCLIVNVKWFLTRKHWQWLTDDAIHTQSHSSSGSHHYVSMLWCDSELPSLRPLETINFDMIQSCFTLQEILCIDIPWGGGLDQNLPIGTGVGLGNRAPGKSLFHIQGNLFEAYSSKGCKIFLASVRSSRGNFYGLLLKSAYLLDDIAQFPIGSVVLLTFERGNLCSTGADGIFG